MHKMLEVIGLKNQIQKLQVFKLFVNSGCLQLEYAYDFCMKTACSLFNV